MKTQEILNLSRLITTAWLKGSSSGRTEALQTLFYYEKTEPQLFTRLVAMISLAIYSRTESAACVEDFLDNIYLPREIDPSV